MLQEIINAIIPVAVTALIAILTVVIKGVGDAAVAYIGRKKEALIAKIGADTYSQDLAFAKSAWAIVDEKFRITPTLEKTFAAKQAEFAVQIKKFIPGITDDEIEQLRQAVAGEVNKGKDAIEGQTQGEQGNGLGVVPAPVAAIPSVAAPVTSPTASAPVTAPVAPTVTVVPAPQTTNA